MKKCTSATTQLKTSAAVPALLPKSQQRLRRMFGGVGDAAGAVGMGDGSRVSNNISWKGPRAASSKFGQQRNQDKKDSRIRQTSTAAKSINSNSSKLKTTCRSLVSKYPERFSASKAITRGWPTESKPHVGLGSDPNQNFGVVKLTDLRVITAATPPSLQFSSSSTDKNAISHVRAEPVVEMSPTKRTSLLEQKRIQWEKEREESHGLYTWGRPAFPGHSGFPSSLPSAAATNSISYYNDGVIERGALNEIKGTASSSLRNEYYSNSVHLQNGGNSSIATQADITRQLQHLPPIIFRQQPPSTATSTTMTDVKNYHRVLTPVHDSGGTEKAHRMSYLSSNSATTTNNNTYYHHHNTHEHQHQHQVAMPNNNHARGYYYDDDHTSGYQSGNASRQNSGDGGQNRLSQSQYDSGRNFHQKQVLTSPIMKQTQSYENFYAPSSLQQSPVTNQLPAHAMRSSFAIGSGISDSGYIKEMKEKERNQWIHDLQLQINEQKQQKEIERGRWGDKGIGVGHFWEPSLESDSRLPPPPSSGNNSRSQSPPAWAQTRPVTNQSQSQPCLIDPNVYNNDERGRFAQGQREVQVFYMNQSVGDLRSGGGSPSSAIQQQQPVQQESTFLRGQNVPVDPETLQEKEKKRLAALEHQNAIKKQIEERQKKLKEERDALLRQDAIDEQRIREQQLKLLERAEMEKKKKQQMDEDFNKDDNYTHEYEQPRTSNSKGISNRRLHEINSRLQSTHVQNSDEIYFPHKNTTSELVQTEPINESALASLTSSARTIREFGTQTEPESTGEKKAIVAEKKLGVKSDTKASRDSRQKSKPSSSDLESEKQRGNDPKSKPRWGAGPPKKPYVKQSDKDPVYQEKLTRIKRSRESRVNSLAKSEEILHVAAAGVDEESESDEHRRHHTNNSHVISNSRSLERDNKYRQRQMQLNKKLESEAASRRKAKKEKVGNKNLLVKKRDLPYSEFGVPDEADSSFEEKSHNEIRSYNDSQEDQIYQRQKGYIKSDSRKDKMAKVQPSKAPADDEIVSLTDYSEYSENSKIQNNTATYYNENNDVNDKPVNKARTCRKEPKSKLPVASRSKSTTRKGKDPTPDLSPREDEEPPPTEPARPQSPPVPALVKSMQKGIAPEEFGNSVTRYELPEKVTVDSTPPVSTPLVIPPPDPVLSKKTSPESKLEEIPQASKPKSTQPRPPGILKKSKPIKSEPSRPVQPVVPQEKIEVVEEEPETPEDVEESSSTPPDYNFSTNHADTGGNYYTSYIPPPLVFTPRTSLSNYWINPYQNPARPSTTESEYEQRKRLIDVILNNDDVQEQLSARESQLEEQGIIEFSIHLPSIYNHSRKGDLVVKFGDNEEIHCSQPSSICGGDDYEQELENYSNRESRDFLSQPYVDPLEHERQKATVRWLYGNENDSTILNPPSYSLSNLSELRKGLERREQEWSMAMKERLANLQEFDNFVQTTDTC